MKHKIATVAAGMGAVVVFLPGCSPAAVLPIDVVESVRAEVGYVLAPTYLPKGFEFDEGEEYMEGYLLDLEGQPTASLMYSSPEAEHKGQFLALMYPISFYPGGGWLMRSLGLTRPEKAVSEVSVNSEDAYLVLGNWDADTTNEISRAVTPSDPRWDYDAGITVYFSHDVATGETVGVMLRADFYTTEWISQDEILRIAESVVLVD